MTANRTDEDRTSGNRTGESHAGQRDEARPRRGLSRRAAVLGAFGLGLAVPAIASLATRARSTPTAQQTGPTKRPWYELGMMADPILDQVLLFYLGSVRQGLADVGECLDTASRVDPGDERSWPREWRKTAERLSRQAAASEARGHRLSAGAAFLRAATYYRAALHRYPEPTDPEVRQLAAQEVATFLRAIELGAVPAEPVQIPYEGTTLPGYLFRAREARGKRPILIVHQGRDAWAEDCKYLADAASQRGYHCLLFDGPGQGKVLRSQGLAFRPDWEKVVTPVVDYVTTLPDVDPDRMALMGISMGGALAPRAAAFEKRLKLTIANPGVYRWWQVIYDYLGAVDPNMMSLLTSVPQAFDQAIYGLMRTDPLIRWGVKDMLWKHGETSPAQLLRSMTAYTNEDIVDRITCRVLVMDGTADSFAQGKALYEALKGPKDYMLFTEEDTGQAHVQVGALAVATERLFDWIDEHI